MYRFIISAIVVLSLFSCDNDLTTIGQEMVEDGTTINVEQYRIEGVYTIKADSFPTSTSASSEDYARDVIYIGHYNDIQYGGETTITPTFQIAPSNRYSINIPESATLDSVTFDIKFSGTLWGDTINAKTQKFSLCQLDKVPYFDDDDYYYSYNTKKIPPIKRVLATTNFLPIYGSRETVHFTLNNKAFGYDMFKTLRYDGPLLEDLPWSFIEYFKGLCIVPSTSNDCIFGLNTKSDSLSMVFHYHISTTPQKYTMNLVQREYQYYNIVNEPIHVFSTLKNHTDQVSLVKSGFAMTQGMSGYMIKLELPQPPSREQYKTLIKAELELKPIVYYNNPIPTPSTIYAYQSNSDNEQKGALMGGSVAVSGNLSIDATNYENSKMTFDLTEYYQGLIVSPPLLDDKTVHVILSVASSEYNMASTFNRFIIEEEPVLRLYYAKYKND